jgi:hypothetical protein
MSESISTAYRMAREGYGWEDIWVRVNHRIPKHFIRAIVFSQNPSLKKEKGNHLHG